MDAAPICLQIGQNRSIVIQAPSEGSTMRIQLPACYHGLPLMAEQMDPNANITTTPNDMWPCKLTGMSLKTPNQTKIQLNNTINTV